MNINKDVLVLSIWIVSVMYLIDRLFIDNEMNNTKMMTYNKLEKVANTGDIIMFRWNIIDVGFRLFSKYSHVGMIVRKNNKLYLLETHPKEDPESDIDNSGIHLYSLKKRLKDYDGDYYYSQLNINNEKRNSLTDHIITNLQKYKAEIPFDTNFRNVFVLNFFYNLIGKKLPEKKAMFCSEFIGNILHNCNIYSHHTNLASLNPGSFLDLKTPDGKSLFNTLYHVIIDL